MQTGVVYVVGGGDHFKLVYDGEQNALALYRPQRLRIASLFVLLDGFGILCWKRQAAILTPTAILFRPIFGRPL